MSRKTPIRQIPTPDDLNSKLIGDYSAVLKEKSGLESENSILKFQIENQNNTINKLTSDINQLKIELNSYSRSKQNSGEEVERYKIKLKNMEDAYTALVIQNDASRKKMKNQIVELTKGLIKRDESLEKSHNDLAELKCKNYKYKQKIEMAAALIKTGNWDHLKKTVTDKEIQTCFNLSRPASEVDFIKYYEEQVLSELFFKENPFTDENATI